jgi:isopenicillin-N epimerase
MSNSSSTAAAAIDRRAFARLFALGGSAALLGPSVIEALHAAAPAAPAAVAPVPLSIAADPSAWQKVRAQFLMPAELSVLNAANLCPSPAPVLKAVYDYTQRLDREPVQSFRSQMAAAKEPVRKLVASYLHVTPEEILLTRNTSEANNLVSSGLDLKAGDEVLLFEDNHPSNLVAWREKAKRFGYSIVTVKQVNPHPGPDYYIDAFTKAITPRTKVLAFTHLTSTAGDLLPARELCRIARERDVLTLVDGAQTFGLLDVDLAEMQPDFYTGSAHKWTCGPKEVGILYVHTRSHAKLWPSIYSVLPGQVGLSRTHEAMGQRDEPALHAFGEAIAFLTAIGQPSIEARSRELGRAFITELSKMDGVKMWTSPDPTRSVAVVSFQPGTLDPAKTTAALERDGIVCATRAGADRPGIRFSPHFYNTDADVERSLAAVARCLKTGV